MQRSILAMFTLLIFCVNHSCKKSDQESPVDDNKVVADKSDVKTYEIIDLTTKQNLATKYSATFGTLSIELIKTSDTTLSFYVPDVTAGPATLKFELASIDFNVTKTIVQGADAVINNLNQKFDTQVQSLPTNTPSSIAEINKLNDYRQEMIALFNGLTESQKSQALLIYEANKAEFQSYASNTFINLNASTTMRLQSDCPKTNFRIFYDCTGENLGAAGLGLKKTSKKFLSMLLLAGVSAYLAPASFGISASGTVLGGGAAAYMLFAEVLPASVKFKDALIPYMESRWIFSKALFEVVISDFQSQVSTGLNLKPSFRTISAADGLVSSGTQYFISSMTTLEYYWNKLTAVFGDFPSYKNTEAATSLATSEISISGVSNANVQYVSHSDQAVTFKSVSGKDETFNYTLRVTKQGFTEEKTLTAKVKVNCSAITFGTSMSAEGSIAILNVQGGVAPYMYSVANSPYQSSQIFVGPYVSGNSYLIKIKDANNCETSETRLISKDPCSNLSTITDPRDGEVYKIVQIGNQTWFVENLRYSGNVPNISDYNQWTNNTTGAWSYYLNDASFNIPYGKLYNWHAVKNSSICPAGWHVPSDAEWTSLAVFLGGESVAGGKMKSTGTQYWQTPNTDATNSSCFSALPGGYRSNAGVFNYKGSQGNWWSSTDNNVGGAWYRGIDNNAGSLGKGEFTKLAGYSVRCVKD